MQKIYLLILLIQLTLNGNGQFYINVKCDDKNIEKVDFFKSYLTFSEPTKTEKTIFFKDSNVFYLDSLSGSENYGSINVRINNKISFFILERGDTLNLDIQNFDTVTQKINFQVLGKNSSPNSFINEYISDFSRLFSLANSYYGNNILATPYQYLNTNIRVEINEIKSQLLLRKATQAFINLSEKTITAIQINEFLKPLLRPSKFNQRYATNLLYSTIDSVFDLSNPSDTSLFYLYLGKQYMNSYYEFLEMKLKKCKSIFDLPDSLLMINNQQIKIKNSYTPYTHIQNPRTKEFLWGINLNSLTSHFPENLDSDDIEVFDNLFPNSVFINYPKKVLAFSKQKFSNSEVGKMLGVGNGINDVESILKLLPDNKVTYIDIWASWCIPCKQEFLNGTLIDSFLTEKKVNRIYISIDEENMGNSWEKNIKSYELKGINILANTYLRDELYRKFYSTSENFSIPRYIIYDKNKKLVSSNAPRPSDSKLKNLINSLTL